MVLYMKPDIVPVETNKSDIINTEPTYNIDQIKSHDLLISKELSAMCVRQYVYIYIYS